MSELLAKEPLFKRTSEIDQLRKIFDTLSTPREKIWPGSSVLFDDGLDLLNSLLTYDPKKGMCVDCRLAIPTVYFGSLFHNQQVYPCCRRTVWSYYSYAIYAASYQSWLRSLIVDYGVPLMVLVWTVVSYIPVNGVIPQSSMHTKSLATLKHRYNLKPS
ncbi:hypothetical protein PTKIN_Ptkin17bG0064000 [Pterospermum kingtungense]